MSKATATEIAAIANRLDDAARNVRATEQLGDSLDLADAYAVQAALVQLRYARGERRIGVKMGFTSRAKMAQMGVNDVIWGRLTDRMLIEDGGSIDMGNFVHPRVEPEIAFLLCASLPGTVTPVAALAAVAGVAPALEIIDSRYRDFRFSLCDVIADNSSSSAFVVGPWADPRQDLSNLGMILEVAGIDRQIGSSAAILGNPIRSLVAAARQAYAAGEPLQAGDIIMAGGVTAAEALNPGQRVRLTVQRLGSVEFHTEPCSV
jgi:2-oxo-3-hexenedioate decarboxylase